MSATHPELAKEFHLTKNDDLTPQDIVAGTGKKLWWLCESCGHEWQSMGANRSKRGQGCPACSGRVVHSDGRNSMASTHPSLADDLHPTKNGDLTSDVLIAGTNKKLWWLCSECEHEWPANGNDRVQGNGCPACAGRVVHSDGRNSMANTHPELASEFHTTKNQGISASDVTAGTDRKLWWLCPNCDHEWSAYGYSRASGSGCPACANQTLHSDGRNSMGATHPDLAKEFHPTRNGNLSPRNVVAGTGKKLWWLCAMCQHEWQKPGSGRVSGRGCPACKNKAVHIDGRNTMAVTHPDLAKEFHPTRNGDLSSRDVVAGTNKKLWWLCSECEHEWSASGHTRAAGRGCPACSNKAIHVDGRNSMAATHPDLAGDFHPTKNGDLSPRDVTAGTQRKLWWLCSTCESEWAAVRHSGRHGCPACSGHAVHSDGRNSMAATHPHLAKEIHPTRNGDLTPGDVLAGTGKKLWWLCSTCEHEWSAAGSWRVAGNGCGACANQALHIDGRNSLATVNPEVASEFHPEKNGETTPENIVAGSEKKVWWLCETCEHEWRITPGNRTGGRKSGCPACSNKALHIRGLNSLAVTHPDLAAEFHPEKNEELTPRDIIAGTHKKLWWLCSTCGHEWDSAGGWRIQGNGCPACAPTGFQAGLPGYYYVHGIINVETQDLLFYKGGISGNWIKRLEQLMRGLPPGLEIQNIETIWFEIGQSAMELESRLKAVHEIRAPKREFGGGDELFLVNPLDFARENGWV